MSTTPDQITTNTTPGTTGEFAAAAGSPPPDSKPRRRYILRLEVGADTEADLVSALEHFATEISMRGASPWLVSGGWSWGASYDLNLDEAWDGERYRAALMAERSKAEND
jgi:hypothetical protein